MACENCFNGCADITSDKCVKYTGVNIPGLDIHTGDSLFLVEQKITTKILTLMDGTGIIPILDPADICDVVQELMPCCPPFTLNDILTVFLKAICILNDKNEGLKTRIAQLEQAVNVILNAPYEINCLEGVDETTETHDIVQAIIDKLCVVSDSLALYVPLDQLNDLIADYLSSNVPANLNSNKMVPFVALPYFGDITGFDITGAGSGLWERIFLCNGQNGTPDLRGRTLVGATTMGQPPFNPAVDPAIVGNPLYDINTTVGANGVILNVAQMPDHNHGPITFTSSPHTHNINIKLGQSDTGGSGGDVRPVSFPDGVAGTLITEASTIVGTVALTSNGGGEAHPNIQPSRGSYFIMYIPA